MVRSALAEGIIASMSAADLHKKAFFKEVVDRGAVWLLRTDDDVGPGYARAETPSGEVALGVWSTESRATKIASSVPAYADYRAERVELEDFLGRWIPQLDEASSNVGLNWSGPRAQGARVMTYAVVRGIRQRQWELDAPERARRREAEWGN